MRRLCGVLALGVIGCLAFADEGMWLYTHFPKDAVKQKYGAQVGDDLLRRLETASVRIGTGSGALVSANGLILTNQHLVSSCLIQQSSRAHDYLRDGYYADTRDKELHCPNLSVAVLTSAEDVDIPAPGITNKNATAKEALRERDAAISRVKADCVAQSHQDCEVVSLFAGSRYQLYRWKNFNDVRLVFAPEEALAFFGRERDSITYLRYGLDAAFLRVYENGSPAVTPTFLKWSDESLKDGDLVFAAGNPQTTVRETTAAQLTFYRDTALPLQIGRLAMYIREVNTFAARSEDNKRAAEPLSTQFLEAYKSAAGKLIGLRDDRLVARKTIFDQKIRQAVERDPKLGTEGGKVWDQVAAAYKAWAPNEKAYELLEEDPAPGNELFRTARQMVRGTQESARGGSAVVPNQQLQVVLLTQYLQELKQLAEKDKGIPMKSILNGNSPQQAAETAVRSSRLSEAGSRRRGEMNREQLENSDDGMIRLALALEEPAERIRKKRDEVIGTLAVSAANRIAQYRYRLFGDAEYPDGTGSPRVEFGVLKGYMDRAGVQQPFAATFGGLYYRRNNSGPYMVPQRWVDAKASIDLVRPLDFVSTCDIGGGDAGAAVVNRSGELVGIMFDGNLESLPSTYLYTDEQARGVSVATQGIVEALEKVYRAEALLREIGIQPGS